MKKKKGNSANKNNTKTNTYDLVREQTVLLEKMHSDIKAIAEGHGNLAAKIQDMDQILQELNSNSFKTEMNVQAIKSVVGTLDIKVDRLERELGTVSTIALQNSRDIKELKTGHERIEQKLDTVTADHETRLRKLEAVG